MKISEAKESIKELFLNTQSVTALVSERGVGKTSAYKQCAEELGVGYIGLYGAALEGPDFMGLPHKDVEKGITRYLAPQFLPTVQAVKEGIYPGKGILVIEEINRVPSDTTSVLYPLLLEKKINNHDLAPGWSIGVTMNPDTMNYLVNFLDDAMLDRFISIEVSADLDDYIEYSLKNNPNQDVLSFLRAFPDMLLIVKKSADSTALSKSPTPRGWTKIQELLNNCRLDPKLMKELIGGILGPQAAAAFFGFLAKKDVQMPSTKDVLNKYDRVRKSITDLINQNRPEMLNSIIKKVVNDFKANPKQLENMNLFLQDIPEEFQILFFKYVSSIRPNEMDTIIESTDVFDRVSEKLVDLFNAD